MLHSLPGPPRALLAVTLLVKVEVCRSWFDQLAAPIRFYYTSKGGEEILRTFGLSEVRVTATGLYGWRGRGVRGQHR